MLLSPRESVPIDAGHSWTNFAIVKCLAQDCANTTRSVRVSASRKSPQRTFQRILRIAQFAVKNLAQRTKMG